MIATIARRIITNHVCEKGLTQLDASDIDQLVSLSLEGRTMTSVLITADQWDAANAFEKELSETVAIGEAVQAVKGKP